MLTITLKLNLNQANIVQAQLRQRLEEIERTLELHVTGVQKCPDWEQLTADGDDIRRLLTGPGFASQ